MEFTLRGKPRWALQTENYHRDFIQSFAKIQGFIYTKALPRRR